MIRALFYLPGSPLRTNVTPGQFSKLLRKRKGLLWVDFVDEPPEIAEPILQGFNFHPLAIDDALQETHIPKLDDWNDYLYIVLNYMHTKSAGEDWETEIDELDVFLGPNYVVTHHDHPIPSLDAT